MDERLANFVVGSHMRSHPSYNPDADENINPANNHTTAHTSNNQDDDASEHNASTSNASSSALDKNMGHIHDDGPAPLDQAMLRKYIAYARSNVKPILHDLDTEKVGFTKRTLFLSNKSCFQII